MMVGFPACGKSTFVALLRQRLDLAVISMDALRELVCVEMGIRYADSMVEPRNVHCDSRNRAIHAALMQMMDMMASETHAAGRSLVWDRTNLTRVQRQERFAQTPGYARIGVYIPSTQDEALAGCADREARTGKVILPDVLHGMFQQFEAPRAEEFDLLVELSSNAFRRGGTGMTATWKSPDGILSSRCRNVP